MKNSQEPLQDLISEAKKESLQLPAFQRDWKLERKKFER